MRAPGQQEWINLLKGEPLLILLDELPPYLENGFSISIGASNLAQVTTTAPANLFVAVGKDELSNVCIVISDLGASYAQGMRLINEALANVKDEINRSALNLETVGMKTGDEIIRRSGNEVGPSQAFETARLFLYYCEAFHHKTECFAIRLELAHRQAFYKTWFEQH